MAVPVRLLYSGRTGAPYARDVWATKTLLPIRMGWRYAPPPLVKPGRAVPGGGFFSVAGLAFGHAMKRHRLRVYYSGRVQGGGFRYRVKNLATGFALVGWVKNLADGRVELLAEGEAAELAAFQAAIRESELGRWIGGEAANLGAPEGGLCGFDIVR